MNKWEVSQKDRNHKKEPRRNFGAEVYRDKNQKHSRELQ